MIDVENFYNYLVENKLDFFAGVPDSLLKNLCACIKDKTSKAKNIITANEGNAVGMCAGYHLSTGKYGIVYMQNSGEGNAVNPLMSLADGDVYSLPMLLIIGWRGEPGKHDEPQHVKQGKVTLPLLEAMDIPYEILGDNYEQQITKAISYFKSESKPYALVVKKGTFSNYKIVPEDNGCSLTREQALEVILENIGKKDLVVSTTGKTSREIFELREAKKENHSHDFLTVGSMGHTASIAYGVSIGTDKKVWCIDGDGSFIMHMGSLAVIGENIPTNFKYIVNDNNAHESVGGQPTCTHTLNIKQVLLGCGFKQVIVATNAEEIKNGISRLANNDSAAMVLRTRQGSREDLGRPTTTPIQNKIAFMEEISK